jgi:hypothetical protein
MSRGFGNGLWTMGRRISASKMAAVCVIVADANSVGLRMQRRPGLGAHLLPGASGGLAAGAPKGRGMGSVQVGDADRAGGGIVVAAA